MMRRTVSGREILEVPPRVEASLWRRLRFEYEQACREQIFGRYRALAKALARRQLGKRPISGAELPDVEQLAYEGLLQAIDRYDPLRGIPFAAFARPRIIGQIADGSWQISELNAQHGYRRRIAADRARSIGFDGDDALAALAKLASGLAVSVMLDQTGMIEPADGMDHRPNAYESLAWRQMQAVINQAITQLPERQALIIREHYLHGVSFAQIAQLIGVSKGRVSQLHGDALRKLAQRLKD